MVTFEAFKDGYEQNWASLQIRPPRVDEARKEANQLIKNKAIYQQVQARTGVPWWFVGLCHYRESHYNLKTYLGNGQPLGMVTTIEPRGRGPFTGPTAFVDGAVDALNHERFPGASDWSIARTLFRLEGFNGFGYHGKGVNSPYLYGGSTVYGPPEARAGKYIRDHVFDGSFVDPQLGTATILKSLMEIDDSINFDSVTSIASGSTEPDDVLAKTVLQIQQSLNKLGVVDPPLVEDGKNGRLTKAAISRFQQQNGLTDSGLPDAPTIAAIAQKSSLAAVPMQLPTDLSQVLQRLQNLEQTFRPSTTDISKPTDPIGLVERLLPIIQRVTPNTGTATPVGGAPSTDQLKQVIELLNTVLLKDGKPALGQVNGALGETIGNLLNGKKTAIGIGGSLLTAVLAGVKAPAAGAAAATGLEGLLATIAPILPPQFALPIFLATTAWGILGKMEKWNQGTAPPPKV
jgi:lysozyme family protein/peptidoglycan hydrolase-like protein with peptidoglycan-binding domain